MDLKGKIGALKFNHLFRRYRILYLVSCIVYRLSLRSAISIIKY